jgi:CO/xanthine dehydrogenase FAD-binding subunit
MLMGKALDGAAIDAAAVAAVEGVRPLKDNRFKVALAQQSVAQALRTVGGLA